MDLLVGSGHRKERLLAQNGRTEWKDLVTLDINPDTKPNVVWDLTKRPLPFEDNQFEEIHAYDVLEHLGQQGDWRTFFEEWSEWYRILKPGGVLCGISPKWDSSWAWGDPGHTRIIGPECLTYLSQNEYTTQVGISPMTDYRFVWKGDFNLIEMALDVNYPAFIYVMQAIKPSRISI